MTFALKADMHTWSMVGLALIISEGAISLGKVLLKVVDAACWESR